jgi:hypothetical protein
LTADAALFVDGNALANNTYFLALSFGTDEPYWVVVDNAGVTRYNGPNVLNWAADTDYTVVVRTGGNDNLGLYWNAAWDNTVVGAGTGVRNAAQATSYISGTQAAGTDVWTRNLQFYRRMLEVIP